MLHRPSSRAAGATGTRSEPILDSRLGVSLAPLYLYGEHFTCFVHFLRAVREAWMPLIATSAVGEAQDVREGGVKQ